MKTRLGCLSHKSDSYSDFSEFLPPAEVTAARCLKISTDEVVQWSESFDQLLSHKHGLSAFRAFLKTEFSDENIEFWMACEDYKKNKSSTKLVSKANKIYMEFIDVQAPREINIDHETRDITKSNMESPSPSCFDMAQHRIYMLMAKDCYPRFLRSQAYREMVYQDGDKSRCPVHQENV
ncbi:unnamed protein product [Lota lota]